MKAVYATTFRQRLFGLMGRTPIEPEMCWVFPRCRSIHTLFMRHPIDVAFLDKAGTVRAVYPSVPPWRLCLQGPPDAVTTIECAAGTWSVPVGEQWVPE